MFFFFFFWICMCVFTGESDHKENNQGLFFVEFDFEREKKNPAGPRGRDQIKGTLKIQILNLPFDEVMSPKGPRKFPETTHPSIKTMEWNLTQHAPPCDSHHSTVEITKPHSRQQDVTNTSNHNQLKGQHNNQPCEHTRSHTPIRKISVSIYIYLRRHFRVSKKARTKLACCNASSILSLHILFVLSL